MDYKERLVLKDEMTEKLDELLRTDGVATHRVKGGIALEVEDEVVLVSAVVKQKFDLAEEVEKYEEAQAKAAEKAKAKLEKEKEKAE